MNNICKFVMKVKGEPSNIKRLVEIMQYKNNNDMYMRRILSADVVGGNLKLDKELFIHGDCARSLHSCMFNIPSKNNEGITTIPILSEMLNLDIEIFSYESDIAFEEHYLIKKGDVLINDDIELETHDLSRYDSYETFNKYTGYDIPKAVFEDKVNNEELYHVGGFKWEFSI